MADAAAPGGSKVDSATAIQKYASVTQAGAGADQAVVARVENGIKNSPMGWLNSIVALVESKAASAKSQVQGKLAEQKSEMASHQKDAPKNAGAPPAPSHPVTPAVAHPQTAGQHAPVTAHHEPAAGAHLSAAHETHAAAPPQASTSAPAEPPQHTVAAAVANTNTDAQLDAVLNSYQPRGNAAPEMLGRVKSMGDVANGFTGSLDTYIAKGGQVEHAIAGAANFLGVGKDAAAVWAQNPYRKIGGVLGGIMTGLSGLKSVCSVVGSVCGKIGMLLTVVGLFAMIFPPIGAAVEAIARILNVIGLVCDAISFATSGILTGLNGVVLAQQIANGASAEEKAATADLMMQEANDAASGLISMAMYFGDGFAKGLMKGASKGPIGAFIRGAKAKVGLITQKISGNVKLFANKIVRGMGFGGVNAERLGGQWVEKGALATAKKWFNNAPNAIERARTWTTGKIGTTAFGKNVDRFAAWSGSVAGKLESKFDWAGKLEHAGERAGGALANAGGGTGIGKAMAGGADRAEHELRVAEMRTEVKDAQMLEEARWNNYIARKKADAPNYRDVSARTQMKSEQTKIAKDAETKLAHNEATMDLREHLDNEWGPQHVQNQEAKYLKNDKNPASGKNTRDDFMDRLHDTRQQRYALEEKLAPQVKRREEIMGKDVMTSGDKRRLAKLDDELKPLEAARVVNDQQERELERLASGKIRPPKEEISNWKDVYDSVNEATEQPRDVMLEQMGWKAEASGSSKSEKFSFKKAHKYDKGSAQARAASAGGAGDFGAIEANARHQEEAKITAFVRATPNKASVASNVRSMLSNVVNGGANKAGAAGAPGARAAVDGANATRTPGPAPANAPAANDEAKAHAPGNGADTAATGAAANAVPHGGAANAPAPANAPANDEGGGSEALPYWPKLMPEFDQAQHDFGYMRKVAVEYRKVQIEGKKKSVDALAVYGKYQDYAKQRAAAAQQHQQQSQQTGTAIQANVTQAGTSEQHAGEGESKQEQGRSAANDKAAVELPEPEARSWWDRIIGAIKRWAKSAASAIFGFIQETIASLVLKCLCNVTMGDLKQYAGALKREQQAAHGVAGTAAQTSGQVGAKHIQLQGKASQEAQTAADTITECDAGIIEADQFLGDITAMEAQLADEKAYAQDFLGKITAEAHEMRAARAQGGGADHADGAAPGANGPGGPGGHEQNAPAPANEDHQQPELQAVEKGEIKSAVDYVGSSSEGMVSQLEARQENYQNDLAIAMVNRSGKKVEEESKQEGKHVVEEFKTMATHLKANMDLGLSEMTDGGMASNLANQVIMGAQHLEESFQEAEHHLDMLYEKAYSAIQGGKHTLGDRMWNGDNAIGRMNQAGEHVADHEIDEHFSHPEAKSPT